MVKVVSKGMDIEDVRAEALRKLGRNVVNFSKIEAVLKWCLSISRAEGTTPKLLEELQGNQASLRKQTMGRLVQEFNQIVTDNAVGVDPPAKFGGEGIAYSVKFVSSTAFVKAQRRALSKIVAERNKLIHEDLVYLDGESIEDYQALICLLDEQNPRLLRQLEELGWMTRALQNALVESLEALKQQLGEDTN
jgi:hypothetical protein